MDQIKLEIKMKKIQLDRWKNIPVNLTDPDVIEAFTHGLCGALAKAINHITNCQMIRTRKHMAVITFDGKVLDIEGVHYPSIFERKWGKSVACRDDDVVYFWGTSFWEKAMPFAELLAEKYLDY